MDQLLNIFSVTLAEVSPLRSLVTPKVALLVGAVALVAVVIAVTVRFWPRRTAMPGYRAARESETSRYEQVLSELQGIKLGIENGDGRGTFAKIARLVRIFIDRSGVSGARDMEGEELRRAVESGGFNAHQSEVLMRVFDRCNSAAEQESHVNPEFDPMELVTDFRAVIDQVEGRDAV